MSSNVDAFFPKRPSTQFTVRNICPNQKTVKVFNYPIPYGKERDLLTIPDISESDLRHALMKGSLYIKFMAGELEVVYSDIDLLQFNEDQKFFLESIGITTGLGISVPLRLDDVALVGVKNGVNTSFFIPEGFFLNNQDYKISIYLNGLRQVNDLDFSVSESGGVGTGFDTINLFDAPVSTDTLIADYYPVGGVASDIGVPGGLSSKQHEALRQLIHLADNGPMEGFASGAYRETLPLDNPFPTSITWWDSSAKLHKIVEKDLSYDGSKRIASIVWTVYDADGNLLATVTDTFAYNGSSPFESSRTRTVS